MKKWSLVLVIMVALLLASAGAAFSQCSICTKTAQQMGEQPAKGLNAGIIYLAAMPFLIFSYIGYRWWKSQQAEE
jgi:F0F1-type ATP synthase membrane subunit c/vacuolar-type H+-ATPase subunit K